MKKLVFFLFIICCGLIVTACFETKNEVDERVDMSPRLISTTAILNSSEIAETVKSAIVGVSAKLSNGTSIGSGVAIADGGYVLTNHHVISGGKSFTLYLANKNTTTASLVWSDASVDLAVLKARINLPYLDTAPLSEVSIGDDVLAVGTPLSLQFQHTFTKGIVSALNRTIEIESLGGYVTYMQNLIQHDASINNGNSGGPLINSQGKVIGINSLKASDAEGIGFAIPIETALAVTNKIIPEENFKQVYLGIFGCDAELAKYNNQTTLSDGVYVVDVAKNSPADISGIQNGEVILFVNGEEIKNNLDFRKAIYSLRNGDEVQIETYNNGEKIIHKIKI